MALKRQGEQNEACRGGWGWDYVRPYERRHGERVGHRSVCMCVCMVQVFLQALFVWVICVVDLHV